MKVPYTRYSGALREDVFLDAAKQLGLTHQQTALARRVLVEGEPVTAITEREDVRRDTNYKIVRAIFDKAGP